MGYIPEAQAGVAPAAPAPMLFLMVGLPGSGKTVRARELAVAHAALRITADEWALAIFGNEERHQEPGGRRWLLEGRLVGLAVDALRLHMNVVLDFGLWSRDERSALRWLADVAGASCQIVYLPVEREVQWRRIQNRWNETPEQTFPMVEAEVDRWREQFEVPDADELSGGSVPAPPPGNRSWLDWAQRFWPSLAGAIDVHPSE